MLVDHPTTTMCFQFSMLNIYHLNGHHLKGLERPQYDKELVFQFNYTNTIVFWSSF
jgi:hypothetical protein